MEDLCILDDLKADKSKVFVVLTKFDDVIGSSGRIESIANDLRLSDPIAISSKTGYEIHKLKNHDWKSVIFQVYY